MQQNIRSFAIGVPAISFVLAAGGGGIAYESAVLGGILPGITGAGAEISTALSISSETLYGYLGTGAYYLGYGGAALGQKLSDIVLGSANMYLLNKAAFDRLGRSIGSSFSHSPNGVLGPSNQNVDNCLNIVNPLLPW